jgi:glutamate/tyrosine decarboxylase-like PLP-dependent enzyme
MKNYFKTISKIFLDRSGNACIKVDRESLIEQVDSLGKLSLTRMVTGFAELYARYNPNVYAKGNNARLYTNPELEALLGNFIALLGNNSGGTGKSNPVGSIMAQKVFDFFIKDVVGYSKGEAIDTSGGMAANAMAIHLARFYFDKETKNKGNSNMKFVLLTSDQCHYSLDGAVNRAGLGIDNISYIQTHSDGTMNLDELDKALYFYSKNQYCIVVGSTLGTTVLGAMDNVDAIADLCLRYREKGNKVWHHVDASWGGPIAISKYTSFADGLAKADSVTLDTHKAFKATIACGVFVTKHIGLLVEANFSRDGKKYLYRDGVNRLDNGERGLECAKPDRTLSFGLLLLSRGRAGLSNMINKDLDRAKYFTRLVATHRDLILMHDPHYLNVCIQVASSIKKYSHSEFTQKAHEYLAEKETSKIMIQLCKETKSNTFVLRCVFSNPLMDSEAVHMMISEIVAAKKAVGNDII